MKVEIYGKDSRSMSEVPTGSIDLIVTSPPYWDIVDYNNTNQLGKGLTYQLFIKLLQDCLIECMRVLKEDGFAAFIVGDIRKESRYSGKYGRPKLFSLHSDIINYFTCMDFDFFQHFIWKKYSINKEEGKIIFGSADKNYGYPPYLYTELLIEHILIFRKPGKKRVLVPYAQRSSGDKIPKEIVRSWLDPVWLIDSPVHPRHPAICAPEVINRIIRLYSLEGDTVLDPFAGVGTTVHKALELNRNAIAFEIKTEYVNEIVSKYPSLKKEAAYHHGEVDLPRQLPLFQEYNP